MITKSTVLKEGQMGKTSFSSQEVFSETEKHTENKEVKEEDKRWQMERKMVLKSEKRRL